MIKSIQAKIILIFFILGVAIISSLSLINIINLKQIEKAAIQQTDFANSINNIIANDISQTIVIMITSIVVLAIVTVLVGYFIYKVMVKPIDVLIQNSEKIANGEDIEFEEFDKNFKNYKLIPSDNLAKEIEEIYNDIIIQSNENNVSELGFKTLDIAMRFVRAMSKLAIIYLEERTRYSMQFLADIVKKLNEENLIIIKDLYSKKENDVIKIIESSRYSKVYNIWKNAKKVNISNQQPEGVYFVHHGAKRRYINPLVNGKRITLIEKEAKELIDKVLNYDMSAYIWLDFDF